jgi:hypothetical protein
MKYTIVLHLLGGAFELRFFKTAFFDRTIEQ